MKSIRLNKDIRAEIVCNIMQSYSEENIRPTPPKDMEEVLHEAVHDWFLESNKALFTKLSKQQKDYPALLNTARAFDYKDHNGGYHSVNFSTKATSPSKDGKWLENVYKPKFWEGAVIDLSNPDAEIPPSIQVVLDDIKSSKKVTRLQNSWISDYDREYENYEQDVTQVLEGCNTSGQLLEVWEEVEKFLPKGVANPSRINLPSVNIAALNRKLGK